MLVEQALEAGRPYRWPLWTSGCRRGMDGVETTRKIWAVDPSPDRHLHGLADIRGDEMFERIATTTDWSFLKKPFDTVERSTGARAH